MKNIMQIPISKLFPHPANPRKNVGDITELAESISVNGILQNLTVVPRPAEDGGEDQSYTVIIGHRRLAAAALAGLDTVPCVIENMSEAEQIRTMLVENVVRSDLSLPKQAQALQMMIDLGCPVKELSAFTGLSESTVRNRLKLRSLDPDEFQNATERGATLFDLLKISEIEDPALQNKVLRSAGTRNYANVLAQAEEEEKWRKTVGDAVAVLNTFAEKVETVDFNRYKLDRTIPKYSKTTSELTVPEDQDSLHYCYYLSDNMIDVYREKTPEEAKQDSERNLCQEKTLQLTADLNGISERHYNLRRNFIGNYGAARRNSSQIMTFAACSQIEKVLADAVSEEQRTYYIQTLIDLLDLPVEKDSPDYDALRNEIRISSIDRPEYTMLAIAYAGSDQPKNNFGSVVTKDNKPCVVYKPNDDLDNLYNFLTSIGYEMSDEELAMQNGNHDIFAKF